jgi:hypothetical protein
MISNILILSILIYTLFEMEVKLFLFSIETSLVFIKYKIFNFFIAKQV